MSPPKLPPPELVGYTYLADIEGGGYADVFLYEQQRPRRRVAIKVLRAAVTDDETRKQFEAEADLMATVSHHPYIVTVHASDVAPSPDNRPYIVMEFYPPPHYGQRSRDHTMPVAEVLRVGVQVATAVEFAHQANIVHRDIKPSNVLTSAYGWPGLTDFGLSTVQSDTLEHARGISIAYAPPEVATEKSPGDVRSDVYSLAATVYALLAGRSPFERAERNSYPELLHRIENDAPPPTGRTEIPSSLELLLRQGLAKRPRDRPASAIAFARALRDIEYQLSLAPTELRLEVTDPDAGRRPTEPDDDPTVVPPKVVDAQGTREAHTPSSAVLIESGPVEDLTAQRPIRVVESDVARDVAAELDEAATVMGRPLKPTERAPEQSTASPGVPGQPTTSRARIAPLAVGGLAALVLVAALLFTSLHNPAKTSERNTPSGPSVINPVPHAPTDARYTKLADGTAIVSWVPATDATSKTMYVLTLNGQPLETLKGNPRSYPIPHPPRGIACVAVLAELPDGQTAAAPAKTPGCS